MRCATCYRDPAIAHWHDPDNRRPRGTSESNWLCESCRKRQPNWEWVLTPSSEVYGTDRDDADDTHPEADGNPGLYETGLCIQIMKLYCEGGGYKKIAKELDCDWDYVRCTIKHWKAERGYFVDQLRSTLQKKH